jgi:lantibiotic modifying enzyme
MKNMEVAYYKSLYCKIDPIELYLSFNPNHDRFFSLYPTVIYFIETIILLIFHFLSKILQEFMCYDDSASKTA